MYLIRLLILCAIFTSSAQAIEKQDKKNEAVNSTYKKEVCTLVLKKLRSSFEGLRSGNVTDKKASKVADLLSSYRLLNCDDEKRLIEVLACTNSQIIFHKECRKIRL